MTELEAIFSRLGLEQYLDSFFEEGFDTWETVLDITESDLDSLGVKLGHRRKLQREIANWRGIGIDSLRSSPSRALSIEESRPDFDTRSSSSKAENRSSIGSTGKRKYRRHAKIDENAPVRGPSAYVIFSNKVREDLKSLNLSFTEIAKEVGQRWQMLSQEMKEPYETQAALDKERYNAEMAEYKKTSSHREYMEYLADFKAKNQAANAASGSLPTEGKRPKLETEQSNESSTSAGSQSGVAIGHERHAWDPIGSLGSPPSTSALNSPLTSLSPPMSFSGTPSAMGPSSPSLPSMSSTPFPYQRFPVGSQGATPMLQADQARTQQLPRIQPLDPRESTTQGNLPSIPTDSSTMRGVGSAYGNPRRPEKVIPAHFLRKDTSMSSDRSSKSSKASSISSVTSPFTAANDAAEEVKRLRALPLPGPLVPGQLIGPYGDQGQSSSGGYTPLATQASPAFSSVSSLALPIQPNPSLPAAPPERSSVFHIVSDQNLPESRYLQGHSRESSSSTPQDHRQEPYRPNASREQRAMMLRDDEPAQVRQEQIDAVSGLLELSARKSDQDSRKPP